SEHDPSRGDVSRGRQDGRGAADRRAGARPGRVVGRSRTRGAGRPAWRVSAGRANVAKKWGKRGKGGGRAGTQVDPFAMQARPPAPRSAPPASSTPLADYLQRDHPGVTDGYVVLPRALVEDMPLPWQQQLVGLLSQFHNGHARLDWPSYRVVPSRPERLVDLDEEQLAEVGYLVEIDADGEMVYRERSGRKVEDPDSVTVLVSCLDPVVRNSRRQE